MKKVFIIGLILGTIFIFSKDRLINFNQNRVQAQTTTTLPSDTDWFTLGGNYQRTSWVNSTAENQTEIRGNLNVEWYQPIEPYIPYKVQPILTNDTAYISTSKGLYAFDLNSTSTQTKVKWVYPTELPLGHSPTVVTVNNILTAYVGGYDKKIHAIDANTGQPISGYTPYEAEAGFETNPLVINPSTGSGQATIYAGNRDGKFYALDAVTGALKWRFKTDGPILFSAAYKNNVLYFASNDSYAYAVNASDGSQIWKSEKLPGAGFHSYWPVIYTEKVTGRDYVVFGGSENFRGSDNSLNNLDEEYLTPGCHNIGTLPCPPDRIWPTATASASDNYFSQGTVIMDVSQNSYGGSITDYYESDQYPDRRTTFVLDAGNGQEYTFDSDGDGKTEYAPFTWSNTTNSGTRYPALASGADGILYAPTAYIGGGWISRGDPVGWRFGTSQVSRVYSGSHAIDEPQAYSGGGNLMYWSLCCDREGGAFDVTAPQSWRYYGYDLLNKAPDYRTMYNDGIAQTYNANIGWQVYSGKNQSKNGVYSNSPATQSPPIPYKGKVYILKGNSLMAWSSNASQTQLPLAEITPANPPAGGPPSTPTTDELKQKLEAQIRKFDVNGDGTLDHLRPGYHDSGFIDIWGTRGDSGQSIGYGEIFDYFQNPAETVVTLIQALPYLSPALQDQIKTYLQTHYGPGGPFDFRSIVHIGWSDGAAREVFDMPVDPSNRVNPTRYTSGPQTNTTCTKSGCGWDVYPPYSLYAAYKYAQVIFNGDRTASRNLFNAISYKLETPDDTFIIRKPYVFNQYLAGYYGYLELQKLAGIPEDTAVRNEYNRLLSLRLSSFTKDIPWSDHVMNGAYYKRALSVAGNFMYLTPELGEYLRQNIPTQIDEAVNEYQYVAPYWFVPKFDESYGEGTLQHLYDYPSLFQAKAYALNQPYNELVKYLDIPAFERGDLFFIQNITAALNVGSPLPSPTPTPGVSMPSPAAWYDAAWSYRKAIVIDKRNVPSDLTDFPALVNRTDTDLRDTANGGKIAQANGNDLLFTDYNGTKLDYEIEKYDPVSGELVAWVKVPAVSSSNDTSIYLYYGNSSASSSQTPNGVWSNNYRGVWHLKEDPAGAAPQIQNSTSAAEPSGTSNGAMLDADQISGLIGGGLNFDGVNDYISIPLSSSDLPEFTLSAWFKLNTVAGGKGIVSWANSPTTGGPLLLVNHRDLGGVSNLSFVIPGGYINFSQPVNSNTWYQATFSRNNDNLWSVYFNGTLVQTRQATTSNNASTLYLGSGYNGYVDGVVDEVEIASISRSDDWIATAYINQAYPETFYIVGDEELISSALLFGGDINRDNLVDLADIRELFNNWGDRPRNAYADINRDGKVNGVDFSLVLKDWGP